MLREVLLSDLDDVRRWRNSSEVRKVMFTDHVITKKEHLAWWQSVKQDETKQILLYVDGDEKLGIVNFFDIDRSKKICHWGFYLSSDVDNQLERMKIWQKLEKEAIEYAFNDLSSNELLCESFKFNEPVIEMHKRFGFKEVGVQEKYKDGKKKDVVITALSPEVFFKKYPDNELIRIHKNINRFSKKCVIFGSANLDFFKESLIREALEYEVSLLFTDVPYGQYKIELNDPESNVTNKGHDCVFFIERIEDLLNANDLLTENILNLLEQRWDEYLELIRKTRENISGTFFIANPAYINSWICSADLMVQENKEIEKCINELKVKLAALCESMSDTYVIDLQMIINQVGKHRAQAGKYWFIARAPFSMQLNQALSKKIIGILLALEANTVRVIALDLDNTLWKGVIGDDGLSGIAIGGDYPGNVFQYVQKIFSSFRARGIALVLCSKNTEQVALSVFDEHPDMILKKGELSGWKINWQPKPQNLKDLSDELDIGLSSFCFIDDNPVEREEMRMSLPNVFVPEMPDEISDWPEFIINLPELSDIGLTDEDLKRADQYKIRAEIQQGEKQASSREDFLKTLGMEVFFEGYNDRNKKRILQLIQKTNQFNTTTFRYSESEFESLLKNNECYAIRIKDRLGSNEIVGVIVFSESLEDIRVNTFVLSCRVLGRGVETAVLGWLSHYLKTKGCKKIIGEIILTERNAPVQNLYSEHDFIELGEGLYEFDLLDSCIDVPPWIKLEQV